jgi:hypothetical protein
MAIVSAIIEITKSVLITLAFMYALQEPKSGYGVDAVKWLPDQATNITYWERDGLGAIRIAEFSIPPDVFKAWCRDKGLELDSRTNVQARRPPAKGQSHGHGTDTQVRHALVFEKREKNGAGLTLIFDVEKDRAYYDWSNR